MSLPARRAALPTDPLLRISWSRYGAAFRRYRWLSVLVVALGAIAGTVFARRVVPEYEVSATLRVPSDAPTNQRAAPIRVMRHVRHGSWPELVTSFAILDKVARRLSLDVEPASAGDSTLFAGFQTDEGVRPGRYELEVDRSGWQYRLLRGDGSQVQAGLVGDSVGRAIGLRWKPSSAALRPGRAVAFTVRTPRDAARSLKGNLTASYAGTSNLLVLTLRGRDPRRTTAAMNAILEEVIAKASDLQRRNLSEAARALKEQLDYAEREQRNAGAAFESFSVQTAALPSETRSANDADDARNAVVDGYLGRQIELENLRHDRQALEGIRSAAQRDDADAGALSSALAAVGPVPASLATTLTELAEQQRALRDARRTFTGDHTTVKELDARTAELRTRTIPRLVQLWIAELARRENDLASVLQSASQQLRALPARTTEEHRLRRSADARAATLASLKTRYQAAALAERNTDPELSVLDEPEVPQHASPVRTTYFIAVASLGAIALALVLVVLLDRRDPRFRHVDQATDELGLEVLAVVPALPRRPADRRAADDAARLLEIFRALRLHLTHAFERVECVALTVTSPSPGDGKSLVCTHLARSFAEAHCRTLLVDGDLRRGELHSRFGLQRQPGLVDYLAYDAALDDLLQASAYDDLTVMGRGTASDRGAHLLMSPKLPALVAELKRRFEVIIVDSAPLGAGIEPFVLGSATGNLLLVLRAGESDRRMAERKLDLLDRLPIRLLGVVLNGVRDGGRGPSHPYADQDAGEGGVVEMHELGR